MYTVVQQITPVPLQAPRGHLSRKQCLVWCTCASSSALPGELPQEHLSMLSLGNAKNDPNDGESVVPYPCVTKYLPEKVLHTMAHHGESELQKNKPSTHQTCPPSLQKCTLPILSYPGPCAMDSKDSTCPAQFRRMPGFCGKFLPLQAQSNSRTFPVTEQLPVAPGITRKLGSCTNVTRASLRT